MTILSDINKVIEIMDVDDDDAPPMLVDAEGKDVVEDAALSAEMDDVKLTKVPITIITGMEAAH